MNKLLITFSTFSLTGCVVKNDSGFRDLYSTFNVLWVTFLLLAIFTGGYYIFGGDKYRNNAGTAAIICLILFGAMLITA
jgi:hypothetical protein